MKILLDTHLILWAAGLPDELPKVSKLMLECFDEIC